MTAVTAAAPSRSAPQGSLTLYRDDGPIARAIGRVVARAVGDRARSTGLAELALVVAAAVPVLAVISFGGDGVSDLVAGIAIAWMVLCAGASTGVMADGRLRWALLPILRLTEYAAVLWLAALAGPSSYPAAFALLAAVAFRHYDLVYRMRLRGSAPAPWVNALSLGWDGRLIGAWLLLAAGALPAGFYVAAAVFGIAFVAEAVSDWVAAGPPLAYEEDHEA
jgi:Family of unknown function (DUF5941)